MAFTRRTLLAGAALAPFATQAFAQGWPSGAIRIVVPFPPGGSTDVVARLIQTGMQQRLGQTVTVENRSGASGSAGTAMVAKSPPDGATWLVVFDTHSVNPALMQLPFDTEKDLDPVLLIGTAPYALAANAERPWKSLADVIAAAKAKPESISYASVGTGSIGHLAMTLLAKKAGIKLVHVPYRGGGPAMNDAIAGHVDMICGSVALITPQLGSGKLRPIAQTGAKRVTALKDVQTVQEAGIPDLVAEAWWGVFAPAGTPKPVIEKFVTEASTVLREERIAKQLAETQQMTVLLAGPEELRKYAAEQGRIWGAVVKEHGIKGEM